jgi:hypothetical protein
MQFRGGIFSEVSKTVIFLQLKGSKFFFVFFLVSCEPAGGARVPAQHAKMLWLEPWTIHSRYGSG